MKGNHSRWLALLFTVAMAVEAARAAQPLTAAQLSGSTPVTVSTTDGRAIKGTLQNVTPELLTVLPTPKPAPKSKPGDATGDAPKPDPVDVPWKGVKRVSNGLTAALALDVWKAKHHDQLCPTCRGERTVWCPTCKGTAHDPAAAVACHTCHGELLVACGSKGEVDGRVPCPNACLRQGVGAWSTHPDGKVARTFQLGGGASAWFSTGHLGHVILLDLAKHTATDAGGCPVCGGTTNVDDLACHGTGKVPCPECLARKAVPPCPNHCDGGRVACPDCGGTGLKKDA